jgi:hypothetical protein
MKNIFILSYKDYEYSVQYYLNGPENATQEDFNNICNNLLEKSGYNAITKSIHSEYSGWVGWNEIVEEMVPLLAEEGYYSFEPKLVEYFGSSIIDDQKDINGLGKAGKAIMLHNNAVKEELYKI